MNLSDFFQRNRKVALAFSGGTDSAYLLYAAIENHAEVCAYYVKSDFQPQFELQDAVRLAEQLHAKIKVLPVDILHFSDIVCNSSDRCYVCKKLMFSLIAEEAEKDGYSVLIDGTNASDPEQDRPGMRALRELHVCSPLRDCGLTKNEIRILSREAGLFTWNKPAYACLATRVATGEPITTDKLKKTEKAENFLSSRGFTDFRIRLHNGTAKIQLSAAQMSKILENRDVILHELKKYYDEVLLDLEGR